MIVCFHHIKLIVVLHFFADMPALARKSFTIDDVFFDEDDEENDIGVHAESYRSFIWIYIGRREELTVWGSRNRHAPTQLQHQRRPLATREVSSSSSIMTGSGTGTDEAEGASSSTRSESEESTISENAFRQNYENVTHRLIHRKASIELYRRILDRTFGEHCLRSFACSILILFVLWQQSTNV